MHIGSKIKSLMESKNITVIDIAEKTGKTRATVYDIQKKPDINTSVLRLFAEILDVPITDFFEESKLNQEILKENKSKEQILIERKDAEYIKQLKEILSSKKEIIAAQKETLLVKTDLLEIKNNIISKYKSENDKLRIIAGKTGDVVVVDES